MGFRGFAVLGSGVTEFGVSADKSKTRDSTTPRTATKTYGSLLAAAARGAALKPDTEYIPRPPGGSRNYIS